MIFQLKKSKFENINKLCMKEGEIKMKSRKLDGAGMEGAQNNMAMKLQKVQGQLDDISKVIADMEFIGTAGGGEVETTVKGDKIVKEIKVKKESQKKLVEDLDMLFDLIVAATNDALRKVDEYTDQEISKITKGIPIPGLN